MRTLGPETYTLRLNLLPIAPLGLLQMVSMVSIARRDYSSCIMNRQRLTVLCLGWGLPNCRGTRLSATNKYKGP